MNFIRICQHCRQQASVVLKSPTKRTFSSSNSGGSSSEQKSYTWLLVFPMVSFGLGTWQVKRLEWKKQLIRDMEERTKSDPMEYDARDLLIPGRAAQLEYKPAAVEGHFDHTKEILLGPRTKLVGGNTGSSGLIAHGKTEVGYQVVTPFVLESGERIMVNRGWVSSKQRDPITRETGQIRDKVRVCGLIRQSQTCPQFTQKVKEDSTVWNYCDLYGISNLLETLPLMIDADEKSSVPGGPIGGQTRVAMRNEHMSYIVTWYGLSAATFLLWFKLRKRPGAMFSGPKSKDF